ncbi:MAG: hypothetical protein AAF197_07635, partial [Pseudomonadota bacterium]
GQFLRAEYDAEKPLGGGMGVPRKDWGHSCIEDVVEMAEAAQIKETYIGHHDPSRSWVELQEIDEMLDDLSGKSEFSFSLAKPETVIDL